jgi:O-antigen ligase
MGPLARLNFVSPAKIVAVILLLATIAALIPVAMVPRWFLYFDTTPKAAILLIVCGCLLFATSRFDAGLAALVRLRHGRWYLVFAAAQIAFLGLSSSLSADRTVSFYGTGPRRLGALEHAAIVLLCVFIGGELAKSGPVRGRVLLRVVCLSGAGIAFYGTLQYAGWDPWADRELYHAIIGPWSVVRPPGTLGHAMHLGIYLAGILFLCDAWAALEDSAAWRYSAGVCAMLAGAGLLLTGTRSAVAAALMAGAFLFARTRPRSMRRIVILAAILLAAVPVFYFSPAGSRLRDRTLQWARSDAWGGPRLLLWRDCLVMARSHLLLGYGSETFAGEFPRYQSAELARAYPGSEHESAHNALLEAVLGQGIAGMLLLLAFAGIAVGSSFAQRPAARGASTAAASLALFAGQQFAPWALATLLLFHLTVVISVAGSAAGDPVPAAFRWAPGLRFLAVPAGAFLLVSGVQIALVDGNWGAVRKRLSERRPEAAIERFRVAESLYPPQPGAELWFSRALLDATQNAPDEVRRSAWETAEDAAMHASSSLEDRANAMFNTAALFWSAGDLAHAEAAVASTIDCAPHWYRPHWLHAELLLAENRVAAAGNEIETALGLAGKEATLMQDTVIRFRSRPVR